MRSDCMLILKSLALNYPIIMSWRTVFPKIITLVVKKGMQVKVMDVLRNFPISYSGSRNSDFEFYIGKAKMKLGDIEQIKMKHFYDHSGKQGFPVIISDNPVVDDDNQDCFFIFVDEQQMLSFAVKDIVPLPEDLQAIYKKVLSLDDLNLSEEEKILKAAVYFLEPYCFRTNQMHLFTQLLETAHNLCVVDEEARDTSGLDMIFVKTLFEWQQATCFSDMYALSESVVTSKDIQKIMLYDSQYIYLSEKLLKEIVEPMTKFVPINSLKKGLLDAGIIDVRNGGTAGAATYTVKVSLYTSDKDYCRVNLIRLNREKVESGGRLGLVDACYLEKEELEDE